MCVCVCVREREEREVERNNYVVYNFEPKKIFANSNILISALVPFKLRDKHFVSDLSQIDLGIRITPQQIFDHLNPPKQILQNL